MSSQVLKRRSLGRILYHRKPGIFSILVLTLLAAITLPGCAGLKIADNSVPTAIAVNPNDTTVIIGKTQQFWGNVTGTSNTAVAWTVSGAGCAGVACGKISPGGLYTPPTSVPSPATVTVKATSVADPTKSASASVTIVVALSVSLSISPTSANVPAAGVQPLTASVAGTSNTAVTWGLSGAGCSGSSCGTLSSSADSAVYMAPSVAPSPATVNVIGTSVTDPSKSASANLTILPAVVVNVTPANVSVIAGATQQFVASVTGTSNTAVSWTVSGTSCSGAACGTINSSAIYTAPVAVPSPGTVTVTATSVADSTKLASAYVTIAPTVGTTHYLAPAADGGSDSNSGTSSGSPWLTPNHALSCGDVIMAAAGTYPETSFQSSDWGTVTCSGGNNVAWLKCGTFDACKISGLTSGQNGMAIGSSYWGVQGFEVDGNSSSGPCFLVYPTSSSEIHHIVLANNVASGCGGAGFSFNPATQASPTTIGVDYISVVGNIVYNSAGGSAYCATGIEVYEPIPADTLPGTHIYIAGNFTYHNVEPSTCGGGAPTDGEGIELDTLDGSQTGTTPYTQQVAIDNNMALANGGPGIESVLNYTGAGPFAHIYIRHNTVWGNNTDPYENVHGVEVGEIVIGTSYNTEVFGNIAATNYVNAPADSNRVYSYWMTNGNGTDHVYQTLGYAVGGTVNGIYSSGTFSYGPNNLFGTNPNFANATAPGAPSCGSATSVPNCMATVIADFTPTNATAKAYGYQIPNAVPVYDPLFPQWLCNVNLPAGLVTMGCLSQ